MHIYSPGWPRTQDLLPSPLEHQSSRHDPRLPAAARSPAWESLWLCLSLDTAVPSEPEDMAIGDQTQNTSQSGKQAERPHFFYSRQGLSLHTCGISGPALENRVLTLSRRHTAAGLPRKAVAVNASAMKTGSFIFLAGSVWELPALLGARFTSSC